ncbi:MAG: 50S ribosomal protein L30 [Clostridiales bacterium]|jgi:large subunit ribosomal protein L30|nr:50S ribosomal protein L30 [Clostridiales bacterium]
MAKQLKVTLVKSTFGALEKHKRTVQALGLRKIRSSAVLPDNEASRGMIFVVKHMITVEELD